MRLFWARGYDAVSIDDLSRAMHVPRASLYAQHHDKEGLFLATVAHYIDTRVALVAKAFAQGADLATDLANFFDAAIAMATTEPDAPGCLIACVLSDVAGANPRMRATLAHHLTLQEERMAARLKQAQGMGQLPPQTDTAALAGTLLATARGLMLRARAGATPCELRTMAQAMVGLITPTH